MPKSKKPRKPYSPKSPVQAEDLSLKRDNEIVPVAREILKIIANTDNLVLGNYFSDQERVDCYGAIHQQIMKLCLEKNVALKDIDYAVQLVNQGLQLAGNVLSDSVKMNTKRADSKLWGKDTDDLTIQDVENVLQDKDVDNPQVDNSETTQVE